VATVLAWFAHRFTR